MKGGFSFCGADIGDLGFEYAPDGGDTLFYQAKNWNLHEEIFEAHDGGYQYGASMEPKSFVLRCYYERKIPGMFSRLDQFFRRGRTGKLVFAHRPWCYYIATVSEPIDYTEAYKTFAGLITIHLKAYYPFARCDELTLEHSTDVRMEDKLFETGLLLSDDMMPQTEFTFTNRTTPYPFRLYNPGTEPADVAIQIAGNVGEGVKIINQTNDQMIRFVGLANTSNAAYIEADSMHGRTSLVEGVARRDAFLYHDLGYIKLAPGCPIQRNVSAHYTQNSQNVELVEPLLGDDWKCCYIWLHNDWRRIQSVDGTHMVVDYRMDTTGSENTVVVHMNEMLIEPSTSMTLTRLNFVYKPTFL